LVFDVNQGCEKHRGYLNSLPQDKTEVCPCPCHPGKPISGRSRPRVGTRCSGGDTTARQPEMLVFCQKSSYVGPGVRPPIAQASCSERLALPGEDGTREAVNFGEASIPGTFRGLRRGEVRSGIKREQGVEYKRWGRGFSATSRAIYLSAGVRGRLGGLPA